MKIDFLVFSVGLRGAKAWKNKSRVEPSTLSEEGGLGRLRARWFGRRRGARKRKGKIELFPLIWTVLLLDSLKEEQEILRAKFAGPIL